ncbi:hypothetical protein T492DRAFT_1062539 [Pavlovales sp. CCMP2436]|nr:hypothetical protein T492DRAFT_1062539 [Pavlovales sp. CCMP2436]
MNGYGHYMPHAAPSHSFDLVGYLVVSPSLVRARETRVLNLASEQNGWETPPRDKECTVDGIWYTFERGTGRILKQGGSNTSLNQDLVLPFIPNVLTRSLWGRNVRQVGKVQVIGRGGGTTVAGVDDETTRRFRDARSPEPLYQLTYRGRNI